VCHGARAALQDIHVSSESQIMSGSHALIDSMRRYCGWRDWAVLRYNSVLENIFVVCYIALQTQRPAPQFLADCLFFILLSFFSTTYGYLVNDWADRELDARHGKANTFQYDSEIRAGFITGLFGALAFLCLLRFIGHPYVVALWLLWLCIATAYSVRPLRLKERGKAGLALVVVAQRVLPALLIFAAFRYYAAVEVLLITLYVFFRGLSSDLNHQLEDYGHDAATRTGTYAVSAGKGTAEKVLRGSLEAEKALLLVVLSLMLIRLDHVRMAGVPVMAPALVAYGVFYGVSVGVLLRANGAAAVNPFAGERSSVFQFLHHAFPSVVLPGYLLVLLAWRQWLFTTALVLFVLYRKLYSPALICSSYPVRWIAGYLRGFAGKR
jgi:4-hydroxybenzoate polyprenyltransferase